MIEYGVKLSQGQMLKLRRGHRVSLKHSALRGSHKLMLTEAQVKKLEKAYKAGKGSTLQLEPSQINSNVMGGSVLSTLKSVPRKFAKLAMDVGAPVAKALASKAGARLKKKAQDFLMEKGERLVDYGLKKVGAGRGRPRKMKVQGEGFGDFLKGVAKVGKTVGKVGKAVYENPIGKRLINKVGEKAVDVAVSKAFGGARGRPRKMKPAVMPMVEGEGFGDFIKGVAKVGKTVGKVGKAVYDNPIGKRLINKVGEKAVDVAVGKAFGGRVGRRKIQVLHPQVDGGNIFTDIYRKVLKPAYSKVIKPVGKVVLPKAVDIGVNLLTKKIAGKGRGRPRKMGSGVFAPGMGGR